jgi:hypothetical protein
VTHNIGSNVARVEAAKERAGLAGSMAFAALMWGCGDVLCQSVEKKNAQGQLTGKSEPDKFASPAGSLDLDRVARQAVFGGLMMAPLGHVWYSHPVLNAGLGIWKSKRSPLWLQGRVAVWESRNSAGKLAAAQTVATECCFVPWSAFMYPFFQEVWRTRGNLWDGLAEVRRKWMQMVTASVAFWTAADFVNLRYTPLHLRFVVASCEDVIWSATTSWLKNNHEPVEASCSKMPPREIG